MIATRNPHGLSVPLRVGSASSITYGWQMPDYRAYIVGKDGRFQGFEVIDATTDDAAIEAARRFVDGHDVEVWYLDRKIAVLSHKT